MYFIFNLSHSLGIDIIEFGFGDKFFLVAIVLESDRLRYERMVARGSARDNVTYEQFLALDQREEELFQTSKTMEMANYTFVRGDYSDEVYHEKIREFYKERFLNK